MIKNTVLRKFEVHHNPLTDNGAIALLKKLKKNYVLESIDLSYCDIGEIFAKYLIIALNDNKTLAFTDINLSGLRMGVHTINALYALMVCPRVKLLNLSDIGLNDDNMMVIVKTLSENTTLDLINLTLNEVSVEAMHGLVWALEENGTLASLVMEVPVQLIKILKSFINRNRDAHRACAVYVRMLLGLKKRPGVYSNVSKDVLYLLAMEIWATRGDKIWRLTHEERMLMISNKKTKVNACIGCGIGQARYMENNNPSRIFCAPYCQLIEFYGLRDIRSMLPTL